MATPPSQRLRDLARLRRVRDRIDRIDRDYAEPPYPYLITRGIERAMALLRRGGMGVTDVRFEVGCSSLGTFSTRFAELVGVPPPVYREQAAGAMAGLPACMARGG